MLPHDASPQMVFERIKQNPQHVNWFFLQKFKEFRQQFIENIMAGSREKGGWFFIRFEWQHRGAIHAHGTLRMGGNTPDTYALASKIIQAHSILEETEKSSNLTEEQEKVIQYGEQARIELINFYDKYVCADISQPYDQFIPPKNRHPPMSMPMEWVEAWQSFLQSSKGQADIPQWNDLFKSTHNYLAKHDDDDDDSDSDDESSSGENENAAYDSNPIFHLNNQSSANQQTSRQFENEPEWISYWAQDRAFFKHDYSDQDIDQFGLWLDREKQEFNRRNGNIGSNRSRIDIQALNKEQRFAYNIVEEHFKHPEPTQLLLRLEGGAG